MIKSFLFSLSIVFPFITLNAQETIAPKYSNEFLSLGVGADAFSMGNAVVASTEGVNATYWNPAGLINQKTQMEASLMHSEYFAGIAKYDHAAYSYKLDEDRAIGFSFIRFGVDDIPNTTQLIDNNGVINYDNVQLFTAGDYAFTGSYAQRLKVKGMSIGGTAKVIYRNIGDFAHSWGFGLDAGWQYQLPKHWKFGIMARDITTTFNAWVFDLSPEMQSVFLNTQNELPTNGLELTLPRLIFAASGNVDLGKKGLNLSGEIDLDMTTDGKRNVLFKTNFASFDPHAGICFSYKNILKVRGGVSNIQQFTNYDLSTYWGFQPNIGVGVKLKNVQLDYAFTRLGDVKTNYYTHVFSLRFHFGKRA
jgi:hypothetical protein